jgi:hypothetical protein
MAEHSYISSYQTGSWNCEFEGSTGKGSDTVFQKQNKNKSFFFKLSDCKSEIYLLYIF